MNEDTIKFEDVNVVPDGVWVRNPVGDDVHISNAVFDMVEYRPELFRVAALLNNPHISENHLDQVFQLYLKIAEIRKEKLELYKSMNMNF